MRRAFYNPQYVRKDKDKYKEKRMCNSNTEDTVCLKNKAHFRENIGHFPKNIGHYLENKAHFVRNKPLSRGSKGLGLQYIWRKQKKKVGRSTNCESERKSWRCDSRFGKVRMISSLSRARTRTHYTGVLCFLLSHLSQS